MFLLLVIPGCSRTEQDRPLSPRDPDLVIQLRWMKSYPSQSRSKADTGLFWALSFLGAKLPADAAVISWSGNVVTVDLDAAGVPQGSRAGLEEAAAASQVQRRVSRDGRYRCRPIRLSELCVAPTSTTRSPESAPTYAEFRARHSFAPRQVAIVESAVAYGNRLIEVAKGDDFNSIAFVAFEGTGSLPHHSFQKTDIETLDLMENGQLRFGLYDLEGHLKAATTPALTAAGKPSKCLFCHEIEPATTLQKCHRRGGLLQHEGVQASGGGCCGHCRQLPQDARKRRWISRGRRIIQRRRTLYMSFAEPTASRLAVRMEHAARSGEATPGQSESQDAPA